MSDYQPEFFSWFSPRVRLWLYGVLTAAVPVLVAYGVLDDQTGALWLGLGGAVFGLGTAYMHTPVGSKREGERRGRHAAGKE